MVTTGRSKLTEMVRMKKVCVSCYKCFIPQASRNTAPRAPRAPLEPKHRTAPHRAHRAHRTHRAHRHTTRRSSGTWRTVSHYQYRGCVQGAAIKQNNDMLKLASQSVISQIISEKFT